MYITIHSQPAQEDPFEPLSGESSYEEGLRLITCHRTACAAPLLFSGPLCISLYTANPCRKIRLNHFLAKVATKMIRATGPLAPYRYYSADHCAIHSQPVQEDPFEPLSGESSYEEREDYADREIYEDREKTNHFVNGKRCCR